MQKTGQSAGDELWYPNNSGGWPMIGAPAAPGNFMDGNALTIAGKFRISLAAWHPPCNTSPREERTQTEDT